MPYVPLKRSYVRKSKYASKKSKSFATKVRTVISRAAQTKHVSAEVSTSAVVANTIYTISPTQNIAAGTSISGRLGDAVKLHKLRLNGYVFAAALANANAKFRVTVFYSSTAKAASTTTSGAFAPIDLFLNNTYTLSPITGQIDEKALTLLADQTIDLNSIVASSSDVKSWTMDIYLKDIKMNFIESGSAFGETKNLYICYQAYSIAGANPTNCGAMFFSYDLQFKDI